MGISLSFVRVFFLLLCILFGTAFSPKATGTPLLDLFIGVTAGLLFGGLLIVADLFLKRFHLRSFNVAVLGLFFGYLMAQVVLMIFNALLVIISPNIAPGSLSSEFYQILTATVFLSALYFGMVMTARASEELHISIPFVKFQPQSDKKKDILIDASILLDSRVLDLATSGLLDHHLILPRFTLRELYTTAESGDEVGKARARRSIEVVKKLEALPSLGLRYSDTDFPEIKDSTTKLVRLARLLDSHIMTADISRIQQSTIEGIKFINIHALSSALKPLMQAGEYLNIKIQRYGKEPRQGVGYLEDGTMVVVNGGAEYIGEVIKTQVLSVKHTSSGRMIFSNALEGDPSSPQQQELTPSSPTSAGDNAHKNYFAV